MSLHKPTVFKGAATALITPFRQGKLDFDALRVLIELQITSGIHAILVAGTTGEASTLSFSELGEVVAAAREQIDGRVPLLAGCGSNATPRACELARIACDAGADALLAVTPYYNKATDRGLLLHYEEICKASSKPVMAYSVPSRTGVALSMKHYRELAKIENMVGVKEASGDLSLMEALVSECGEELDVYTGNDDQTVAAMKLGAVGVISVASNAVPRKMAELCHLCAEKDWKRAASRMRKLQPLISTLFREVNPVPVKYLLSLLGLCNAEYRLPLCPPSQETCRLLETVALSAVTD